MKKFLNHINNYKLKYIIVILLLLVLSLSFYILKNWENKFEKLSNSILMLNIYNAKNELSATGSGFVVFEKDILVTNYHVVESAFKIEAIDENDIVYSLDKVIAFDKEKDLAILKFSNPTDLSVLKIQDSNKVSKGDDVIAIGSPIGLKNTVSKGIVSAIRNDENVEILQITAPISGGSSGGALLNEKGEVIGITYAGMEEGQNLNFAISSNELLNLYKEKLNEISLQDFFYEQNPNEKYKLDCEEISFDELYDNPGKYNGKDVCICGYISSLISNGVGYIVESSLDISDDEDFDFYKHSHDSEYRIIHFSNTNDDREIVNDQIVVGDFVIIYGKLFDMDMGAVFNRRSGTSNFSWVRSIDRPKVIEVIQESSWNN